MAGRKLMKCGRDVTLYVTAAKLIIFKFLLSVTPTTHLLEIVKWNDDDGTTHDPLRMRITNQTFHYLTLPLRT
jgi:hypothetical protein